MVSLISFLAIEGIGARLYLDTKDIEENRKKAIKHLNGVGYGFLLLTISLQLVATTYPIFIVNQIDMPDSLAFVSLFMAIFFAMYEGYHYYKLSSLKARSKDIKTVDSNDEK